MAINVGIIGYGLSGSAFHAPFITKDSRFELKCVLTSRKEAVLKRNPSVKVVSKIEEMLGDNSLQLIIVTSPNTTHYPYAKQSLLSGKHVVVEKPFTICKQKGLELDNLAKRKCLVLSVYQNIRWDGDFLSVKKIMNEERLGRIYRFESRFEKYNPIIKDGWREQSLPGSGLLYDYGPHLIDQALCLFGMPNWLQADIQLQRDKAVTDDYFQLTLGYDKLRVILGTCPFIAGKVPRFSIHGEKGSFIKYGLDPQEEALVAGNIPGSPGWGKEEEKYYGILTTADETTTIPTERGDYSQYFTGIADSIESNSKPPVTAKDAILNIRIIELAFKSSEKSKRLSF